MKTLETILAIALVTAWLTLAVSLLVSSIQGILHERRRERREEESARREREYHRKRMEREIGQIRQDAEYQEKRMKSLK